MRRFFGFIGSQDDEAFDEMALAQVSPPTITICNEFFSLGFCCEANERDWCYVDEDRCLAIVGEVCWPENLGRLPAKKLFNRYRSRGIDFVDELAGQYALFLRDGNNFFLYRSEENGIAVFHYGGGSRLVFANSLRFLIANPHVPQQLRNAAVGEYFTLGAPLGRKTMLDGIQCLFSGDLLVKRYRHAPRIGPSKKKPRHQEPMGSRTDWMVLFRSMVERCVVDRIPSDGGIGLALSGGPSSALLLEILKKQGRAITTFGMHYGGHYTSEKESQSNLTQHSPQVIHRIVSIDSNELVPVFERLIRRCDSPPPHPDALAMSELIDRASLEVGSFFTGIGAAQTFGGAHLQRFMVQHWYGSQSVQSRTQMLLASLNYPAALVPNALHPRFLSQSTLQKAVNAHLRPFFEGINTPLLLHKALLSNRQLSVIDWALPILQSISTHQSLIALNPYMDQRMLALSMAMPPRLIYDKGQHGLVLQRAPAQRMTNEVHGFGVPWRSWLTGPMRQYALQMLQGVDRTVFNRDFLQKAFQGVASSDSKGHDRLIWMALSFLQWRRSVGV